MNIHVYTVAWNEEAILPFFLDHYARFAQTIVVFDQYSTDATAHVIEDFACRQQQVHIERRLPTRRINVLSDRMNLRLKSTCYQESRGSADFVIVCDADEFYYHPQMHEVLSEYQSLGVNVARIEGYQIIAEQFPSTFPLTNEVRRGVRFPQLDKLGVFQPHLDLSWSVGFHQLRTTAQVRLSPNADIKLLHYKFLSKRYVQNRHRVLAARRSWWNKVRRWGRHYAVTDDVVSAWYDEHWRESTEVL